jgi:hypothetical protein
MQTLSFSLLPAFACVFSAESLVPTFTCVRCAEMCSVY